MFEDTENIMDKEAQSTVVEYDRVILFFWGKKDLPFKLYDVQVFRPKEIKSQWLQGQLLPVSRAKKLKPLASLNGAVVSLFGKVELGVNIERQNRIVRKLNLEYKQLQLRNKCEPVALLTIIEDSPYALMKGVSYSNSPVAIEEEGNNVDDDNDDNVDDDANGDDAPKFHEHFRKFPDHKDYLNLLSKAIREANVSKKKMTITWRGINSSVAPNANMTFKVFLQRLVSALKIIRGLTIPETQVILLLQLNYTSLNSRIFKETSFYRASLHAHACMRLIRNHR